MSRPIRTIWVVEMKFEDDWYVQSKFLSREEASYVAEEDERTSGYPHRVVKFVRAPKAPRSDDKKEKK